MRAKAEGTRLGRPTLPQATADAILAALSQPGRPGVRVIAKQFGVDPGTVQRISRPFGEAASVQAGSAAESASGKGKAARYRAAK